MWNSQISPVAPLENIAFLKARIVMFHSSGEYSNTVSELVSQWSTYLNTLNPTSNNIIVSDIDDTVLANYPEILESDFGYIPKEFDEWVESANATGIPQTVNMLKQLMERGFNVVMITGRKDNVRDATVLNLERVGLTGYSQLITRSADEYSLTAAVYKNNARARLVAQTGGTVVGCIGDQYSDCMGTNLGYVMKVPNYMYFLP